MQSPSRARLDARKKAHRSSVWPRVQVGDARAIPDLLPPGQTIDTTITSPPYGPTIDYGDPHQIGYGQSYDRYLSDMEGVFRAVFERTRSTGSLWLVVDTFKARAGRGLGRLVLLPFDLSQLAERAGWVLQDVIIWEKDHTLPWSGRGRLRNTFEYVLFFVKGSSFKYELDRLRDPGDVQGWWRRYPERYSPSGAAPTNIWSFPIPRQGSWGNGSIEHRCPLPDGLVRRMVELTTDPGDVVFDPFAGVGTVPAVAEALGRRGAGIELLDRHVEQYYASVLPEVTERIAPANTTQADGPLRFAEDIANLRHAKFARELFQRVRMEGIRAVGLAANASVRLPTRANPASVGEQNVALFVEPNQDPDEAMRVARSLVRRRPLSKFGIAASIAIRDQTDWAIPNGRQWARVHLKGTRFSTLDNGSAPTVDQPIVGIDIADSVLARPIADSGSSGELRHEEAVHD